MFGLALGSLALSCCLCLTIILHVRGSTPAAGIATALGTSDSATAAPPITLKIYDDESDSLVPPKTPPDLVWLAKFCYDLAISMESEVAADGRGARQQSNGARNNPTVVDSETHQHVPGAEIIDPMQELKKSLEKLRKRHWLVTWYTQYCSDGQ